MQNTLKNQLDKIITPSLCISNEEYIQFKQLLTGGKIVKADNPTNHCGVMFIPYNPETKEVFIVHHKKANQWLVPGGHIEEDELLEDALKREAHEELGIMLTDAYTPFMHSVMPVHNENHTCRFHYDTWFLLSIKEVFPDPAEFNETRWVSLPEANKLVTHTTYINALKIMHR